MGRLSSQAGDGGSSVPLEAARASECRSGLPQITSKARRFAIKELARRAGVSKEFYEKWTVEITPDRTTVSLGPWAKGKIEFRNGTDEESEEMARGPYPVARAGWFGGPEFGFDSDLILPFCCSVSDANAPLYSSDGYGNLICRLDLLASIVLMLSRAEETACEKLDEHGRFPATASLAWKHGFLERPILDEHGVAFAQALTAVVPGWQPKLRELRTKLTHDIDEIGIPFSARSSIAHTLKRQRPGATLRDFASAAASVEPAELALVRNLAAISKEREIHSAFYWKACERGPHDSGYDPRDRKVQGVIEFLRKNRFELGVHPGYNTFGKRHELISEVEYLRQALRIQAAGGRQHYLRWSPESWLDWEACGLTYDSSVGFADAFGFRAGTAFPYRPWSFKGNREINLIEIPLILMDCTAVKYMKLEKPEGLARIKSLVQRVARTGGVFTILWHNSPLIDPEYDGWYQAILNLVAGARSLGSVENTDEMW